MHQFVDAEAGVLALHWDIAPGYYMYDEKLVVRQPAVEGGAEKEGASVSVEVTSPSVTLVDEYFGEVKVYYESLDASVSTRLLPAEWLDVHWQGCSEIHQICYPPQQTRIALNGLAGGSGGSGGGIGDAGGVIGSASADGFGGAGGGGGSSSFDDGSANFFSDNLQKAGGRWLVIALMFLAGVALSFTPCVLPMIPILTGILGGGYQAGQAGGRRLFLLGLTYVLSMAATYSILGVAVALTGQAFQALIQHPVVIVGSALAVFVMALWLAGIVQIRMPAAWTARLQSWQGQRGGGLAGAAIAGCFASLIVSPCISPPLIGALVFVSQTGEWAFGGAALMALGLGMGVPLLLACLGMQQLLPRAGQWMDSLNLWLGVALMLVALWLLERLVSDQVTGFILAVVLVLAVFNEGVLDFTRTRSSRAQRVYHGFLALVLAYALLLFASVVQGERHGTGFGLAGESMGGAAHSGASGAAMGLADFTPINNLDELRASLAGADGRSSMLDVYADWCISCKELERYTFSDPRVVERLSRLHLLRLDVTRFSPAHQSLFDEFALFGPPALLFFGSDGEEIAGTRQIGFVEAPEFTRHLDHLTATANRPAATGGTAAASRPAATGGTASGASQ